MHRNDIIIDEPQSLSLHLKVLK